MSMLEKEPYWLLDTVLGQRDPAPLDMTASEATERNAFLERQHTRWRWMNAAEVRRWDEAESHQS